MDDKPRNSFRKRLTRSHRQNIDLIPKRNCSLTSKSNGIQSMIPITSPSSERDFIKVVVIGESGSGKSNLIQRLVNDRFDERSPSTIGIDFALYKFDFNNRTHHAQIWDTAGMERYRSSITKIFYRDVFGAILVFDLTKRDHFQALPRWLQEIRSNVHRLDQDFDNKDIPIILVGNKLDLTSLREIDRTEAIRFVQEYHLDNYIETSAKNNTNVWKAFQQLFENILEQRMSNEQQRIILKNTRKQKKSKSIKLTRDHYYLEERTRVMKEKKKSNCNC